MRLRVREREGGGGKERKSVCVLPINEKVMERREEQRKGIRRGWK